MTRLPRPVHVSRVFAFVSGLLAGSVSLVLAEAPVSLDPQPRPIVAREVLKRWGFEKDAQGWKAEHECSLDVRDGRLAGRSLGNDPYFHCRVDGPGAGTYCLRMRMRSPGDGRGRVFWSTVTKGRSERRAESFSVGEDGDWREGAVTFEIDEPLADLRIDPRVTKGPFEVDWIVLERVRLHPLSIKSVTREKDAAVFVVKNHAEDETLAQCGEKRIRIPGEETERVRIPFRHDRPFEPVEAVLNVAGLPPVRRGLFVFHPEVASGKIVITDGGNEYALAEDGSHMTVKRDDKTIALIGPIVAVDGRIPRLSVEKKDNTFVLSGEGVTATLAIQGDELAFDIESNRPCEGPVVRTLEDFEGGIFAGLEYLSPGEQSSSTLDIESDEHMRFEPDRLKVTLPLMCCMSGKTAVAMTWDDMKLQPTYAVPDFVDYEKGTRMSLRGKRIQGSIVFRDMPIEETCLWAVEKMGGLPPLPEPPRTVEEQWKLCLEALRGPIKNEKGWGHCVGERWGRNWFSGHASTVWRLSKEVPELGGPIASGGTHVPNEAIYFVTGNADRWLKRQQGLVDNLIRRMQPDGSYRFGDGKYRKGHFEDTALGYCTRNAAMLLECSHMTGNKRALEAGEKVLQYMKRFKVPRGAQTWELSLHTPDQLASAYAVWAYVRGYELTGKEEYLAQARRWALSGIPFVYLWTEYPVMLYATPPVFGATNWIAPNWMGLPVQWVGGVYAYALTMLAPHDRTLDWNHLARGILISAEQQQYVEGPSKGLLPDSFTIVQQRRNPADINPCAIVSLRLRLDGKLDSLAVARGAGHVAVGPFPMRFEGGKLIVEGEEDVKYQVILDGKRILEMEGRGGVAE